MGRSCYAGLSVNFFIAAAILLLFGFTAQNNGGPHGALQLGLGVLMAGAGILLRSSNAPEARLAGLGAAGLTTAVGAYLTVTGQGYVPGTIVAIIALVQLASVKVQPSPGPVVPMPAAPPLPGQPFGQQPYAAQPQLGQQTYAAPPQLGQPAAEPPSFWATPEERRPDA
jgi:hypothetical protein